MDTIKRDRHRFSKRTTLLVVTVATICWGILPACMRSGFHEFELASDPASTCWTQSLVIESSMDDGHIDWPELFQAGEDFHPDPADWLLYLGYWNTGGPNTTWGYFHFALSDALPTDARIDLAHLELWGSPTTQGGVWDPARHALRIFVEASADAPVVTTAEDVPDQPSGRPVSDLSVRWPQSGGLAWVRDSYNRSPDLGPLLQSLLSSEGALAADAHLQLWIRGDFEGEDAEVATCDLGQPGYATASLEIRWCE